MIRLLPLFLIMLLTSCVSSKMYREGLSQDKIATIKGVSSVGSYNPVTIAEVGEIARIEIATVDGEPCFKTQIQIEEGPHNLEIWASQPFGYFISKGKMDFKGGHTYFTRFNKDGSITMIDEKTKESIGQTTIISHEVK